MAIFPGTPIVRDALAALGVWLAFRLLRAPFALREVVLGAVVIAVLHFAASATPWSVASGPYVAQFVGLCSPYADAGRCRCARAELEQRMRARDFDDLAFKFYVDRRLPPAVRAALDDCS
jgi:hypothetical protein